MLTFRSAVVCSAVLSIVCGNLHTPFSDCAAELAVQLSRCDSMWGYESEAVVRPTGNVFNITQLIRYCRDKGMDFGECQQRAIDNCDLGIEGDMAETVHLQRQLLDLGLKYVCEESDALQREQTCLEEAMSKVTDCGRTGSRVYNEAMIQAMRNNPKLDWKGMKDLLLSMGRSVESCVYKVIDGQCNAEVANIFGNFLYGSGVYAIET